MLKFEQLGLERLRGTRAGQLLRRNPRGDAERERGMSARQRNPLLAGLGARDGARLPPCRRALCCRQRLDLVVLRANLRWGWGGVLLGWSLVKQKCKKALTGWAGPHIWASPTRR